MITIKIQWWLGNQMFQYAFIKAFSLRNDIDFQLDTIEYQTYFRKYWLDIFNIDKKYASTPDIPWYERLSSKNKYIFFLVLRIRTFFKKLNKHHMLEEQFHFDKKYLIGDVTYVEWFFQSEKYFHDFESEIRENFIFLGDPSSQNKEYITMIESSNSVSIHVRRWDYITNIGANNLLGTCTTEYYQRAIEHIQHHIENPIFFFFSDDIDWVKENIKTNNQSYYVDWNTGDQSYEDMRLMSLCKHNIIANSSFSWWGAWLNKNPSKIVLAPQRWLQDDSIDYSDVVPDSWIKI